MGFKASPSKRIEDRGGDSGITQEIKKNKNPFQTDGGTPGEEIESWEYSTEDDSDDDDSATSDTWDPNAIGFYSECPSAQMLFICKESHYFVAKNYIQAFCSSDDEIELPGTYMNYELDKLYIRYDTFDLYRDDSLNNNNVHKNGDYMNKNDRRRVKQKAILFDADTIVLAILKND